jgi:hypothetical protein
MTAAPKRKLPTLSKELAEGFPDAGTFENMPRVRKIAGISAGPSVSAGENKDVALANSFAVE